VRLDDRSPQQLGGAARRLDPRTKILILLSFCAATFLAQSWTGLLILLAVALAWAAFASRGIPRRHLRFVLGLAVLGTVVGVALARIWGVPLALFVAPLVRIVILVLAGRAFFLSTPAVQLAWAMQKMHCPRRVVFVAVAARSLFGLVTSEAQLAREGSRIRATGPFQSRGTKARATNLWRAFVAFCARLFLRADQMTAAAEVRGISCPGPRTSIHAGRPRLGDVLAGAACCAVAVLVSLV